MMKAKGASAREKKIRCPSCKGPVAARVDNNPDFPFCSPRCKAVDLAKWFTGAYAVPGPSLSADGEESTAAAETKKPDEEVQ
jgi:endogenous inhibitor of DNA gyrase (YacG/DUF329 family)